MNDVGRFLLYNLAASLLAGLLAWLVVVMTLRVLKVRSAFLYASFLALPLVKSILILLGMGLVLPWNGLFTWQRLALPPPWIGPFLLVWFVIACSVYQLLVRRARRMVLSRSSTPDHEDAMRIQQVLEGVFQSYQRSPCCQGGETVCCLASQIPPHPRILVSRHLSSPVALVEGGSPVIIFPTELVGRLEDRELALALAHELNHFALRKPGGWSSGNLRILTVVSPVALLLVGALHREEEKACDDLAVRILGAPDAYASMLIKSYHFAMTTRPAGWQAFLLLPQLLSHKPFLSERIERLLAPQPEKALWYQSWLVMWTVWGVLFYLAFFAHFGA